MTMKRRHLLISLSATAFASAYGLHKQRAGAELAQNLPLPPYCPPAFNKGNGLFVLYYGYIADPASGDLILQTIMSKQPHFVVFGDGLAARSDIPAYVHQKGGLAIQYIPLGYGKNLIADVRNTTAAAMSSGYDGVFFDETNPNTDDWNAARAKEVRAYGSSKLVIFNPGVIPPSLMFNYADIVCVENKYNQKLPSYSNILPSRWMAVQGDPANLAASSAQDAINRTIAFRQNGGFWYYSTNYKKPGATHIELPSWYETFADWVKSQSRPCSSAVNPVPIKS
jgi:hypothetical protein